jgi:hypothetical protein
MRIKSLFILEFDGEAVQLFFLFPDRLFKHAVCITYELNTLADIRNINFLMEFFYLEVTICRLNVHEE